MKTVIKICGITSSKDAVAAIKAGVDMLGFNFYSGSKRYITISQYIQIQNEVQNQGLQVISVVLFVNTPPSQILSLKNTLCFDYAQLSGDETSAALHTISSFAFKAVRPQTAQAAAQLAKTFANKKIKPALLIDAFHANEYGGTGQRVDPKLVSSIVKNYDLMLAGGLNPDNVYEVVKTLQPYGVDAASGIESSPGIKDHYKLASFVEQIRRAEM